GGEVGAGGADTGPGEGAGGRQAGGEGAAGSEGSVQLHRSGVADHEVQQRRVRASFQRADRGGAGDAVDPRAGGNASARRKGASGANDGSGGRAVPTAA